MSKDAYKDFTKRFGLLIKKHPTLITMTLSNIFTMRLIGNKTHGDLAEIAISEFINQYMYDFKSIHVGKDLYRAKSKEEDITVENEITNEKFPIREPLKTAVFSPSLTQAVRNPQICLFFVQFRLFLGFFVPHSSRIGPLQAHLGL